MSSKRWPPLTTPSLVAALKWVWAAASHYMSQFKGKPIILDFPVSGEFIVAKEMACRAISVQYRCFYHSTGSIFNCSRPGYAD
jgi:hypothetical protein